MEIRVRCKSCDAVLRVTEKSLGRTVQCPKCETKFRIPKSTPPSDESGLRQSIDSDDDDAFEETTRPVRRTNSQRHASRKRVARKPKPQIPYAIMAGVGVTVVVVVGLWLGLRRTTPSAPPVPDQVAAAEPAKTQAEIKPIANAPEVTNPPATLASNTPAGTDTKTGPSANPATNLTAATAQGGCDRRRRWHPETCHCDSDGEAERTRVRTRPFKSH